MASHCQISTAAFRIGSPLALRMRPVRCVTSPTACVMAVVDDEQVVVGVEGQFGRIERPFGQARRTGEFLGERAARRAERRGAETEGDASAEKASTTEGCTGNGSWHYSC